MLNEFKDFCPIVMPDLPNIHSVEKYSGIQGPCTIRNTDLAHTHGRNTKAYQENANLVYFSLIRLFDSRRTYSVLPVICQCLVRAP